MSEIEKKDVEMDALNKVMKLLRGLPNHEARDRVMDYIGRRLAAEGEVERVIKGGEK